jgi:hypothetical protein
MYLIVFCMYLLLSSTLIYYLCLSYSEPIIISATLKVILIPFSYVATGLINGPMDAVAKEPWKRGLSYKLYDSSSPNKSNRDDWLNKRESSMTFDNVGFARSSTIEQYTKL